MHFKFCPIARFALFFAFALAIARVVSDRLGWEGAAVDSPSYAGMVVPSAVNFCVACMDHRVVWGYKPCVRQTCLCLQARALQANELDAFELDGDGLLPIGLS